MTARNRTSAPRPLNSVTLREIALRYVGRFATTRARLAIYLERKLRERGWDDEKAADVEVLVEHFASQGYVDDAGYALSKSRSLVSRGYGPRRIGAQIRAAGITEEDGAAATAFAQAEAAEAALRLARRRRIGPFSDIQADGVAREKAMAVLVRAGHSFALARAIVDLPPGEEPTETELTIIFEKAGLVGFPTE